jgi:hypothetical protein
VDAVDDAIVVNAEIAHTAVGVEERVDVLAAVVCDPFHGLVD